MSISFDEYMDLTGDTAIYPKGLSSVSPSEATTAPSGTITPTRSRSPRRTAESVPDWSSIKPASLVRKCKANGLTFSQCKELDQKLEALVQEGAKQGVKDALKDKTKGSTGRKVPGQNPTYCPSCDEQVEEVPDGNGDGIPDDIPIEEGQR